jgi:molybdopterin-containing oxidoreductase family membrane subunit
VLFEALTLLFSANPRTGQEADALLTGDISPLFWAHVIVGLVLPLAILIWGRGTGRLPAVALLALLGVVAQKLWLLVAGQTTPWLALPEGSYLPSWSEYLGLLGAAALTAALYMVIRQLTGLKEA